jgi:hypothetical protein
MARYILTNLDTQAILGQTLDKGGQRPFVSIAEAYETLARIEARGTWKPEEIGQSFNGWTLCEVNPVERP